MVEEEESYHIELKNVRDEEMEMPIVSLHLIQSSPPQDLPQSFLSPKSSLSASQVTVVIKLFISQLCLNNQTTPQKPQKSVESTIAPSLIIISKAYFCPSLLYSQGSLEKQN